MSKTKVSIPLESDSMMRPAITPEAREKQLIYLASNLLEQRLRDGTASSQEVTTIVKMGSIRERTELEAIKKRNELLEAQIKDLQSQKNSEELYSDVIRAMRDYSGVSHADDEGLDDDEDY